jgi:hypothetical protein
MADDAKLKQAAAKGFLGFDKLYEHAVNAAKENLAQGLNEFGIEDKMGTKLPKEDIQNPNSEYEKHKAVNKAGEEFRKRQQKGSYKGY